VSKIRHFAVATQDPEKSARFYEEAFGFVRVGLLQDHPLGEGVFLSDGTVNLAFIAFSTDQTGHGTDFVGAHHIGILVQNSQEVIERAEALGAVRIEENASNSDAQFEMKFRAPDGSVFDIAGTPWVGAESLDG
jgi:methylmalonyl-CoA/ethylmalonyl-CoA epimerase